jgi:hypothetical protein
MKVEKEVCIVGNMMAIAWGDELKFQMLLKHRSM